MKKQLIILLAATALFPFHFSSCKDEGAEVLPEATTEGKNTFGCLVNGEVWLPKGYDGTPNLDISYDPYYAGGAFNLSAYRYTNNNRETVRIYASNVKDIGIIELNNIDSAASIVRIPDKCTYDIDNSVTRNGTLVITYFDLQNQIISGTFEFTLTKPGCDTIKITQGRFDMKI